MSSPFLTGNYAPVDDELVATDLPIEGRLPGGLDGTLLRNGPNPQFVPVEPYHWFTGDGMLHAIRFGQGRASYRNRWVRTPRFLAEREAGRPLFAGFGQPLSEAARPLDTGVANTHVLSHAGRLLALEEAHLPTRIDPDDLSTLGAETFGGALAGRFTAHPKYDPRTHQLVFFSYSASGPLTPGMSWGTIEADGQVSRLETFEAPYCSMVHDFAVTRSHVVFPVLPLTGDLGRAMSGRPAFAWEPGCGAFLGVLRRDEGTPSLVWQQCEPLFIFHVMNSYDDGDAIVMDVVEYDTAPMFPRADGGPPGSTRSRLSRWRVDPTGRRHVERETLDDRPGEFPRIDDRYAGQSYRHGFRTGPDADEIVHHDLHRQIRRSYVPPGGDRLSEAVFVPASSDGPEGEGWLMTVVYRPDHDGSALLILDATAVEKGPVAIVQLPRRVPFGFHGSWLPA